MCVAIRYDDVIVIHLSTTPEHDDAESFLNRSWGDLELVVHCVILFVAALMYKKKSGKRSNMQNQWLAAHFTLSNKPKFYENATTTGEQLSNAQASLLAVFAHNLDDCVTILRRTSTFVLGVAAK